MPPSLLQRRLHFVVGKGGVGKTTIAAALALLLVRRGRRTLAVEMDAVGRLPTLLGGSGVGYVPTEVAPGLHVLGLDGRAALEEYLGLIIPVKRLLATVFASKLYQYFVAAAPGLKELMTVGKIWYEATREEAGRPCWDAIVVDAPATGHSLQYLRMPQAAREAFGAGLVQREATKITGLLRDRQTTAVHIVTLAEETPVTETLETRTQLVEALGLPLGFVIANRVHRRRFSPAVLERLRVVIAAGSGGVGKTTVAASIALWGALGGRRTVVITIDPARRLADSLGLEMLGAAERKIPLEGLAAEGVPPRGSLVALMLDQKGAWDALVERHAPPEARARILANPFYQHLSQTFAGSHEYMAIEQLCLLVESGRYDLIVVDTPPTRHALDFLEAPRRIGDFLDRKIIRWFLRPYFSAGWSALRAMNRTAGFLLRRLEQATGVPALAG